MTIVEDTSCAMLQAHSEGVERFRSMGLGLSVHWGLTTLTGRGEWVMHRAHIPIQEYEKLVDKFNPARFEADAWATLMAEVGARAFVITAKHHDGFCMYDTSLTDYKVTNTPFGRDPIAELATACQKRDIALYFYYSLLDWHHPDYSSDWTAYVAYYQTQVRELCSKYGEIGGFVFDGYWPRFAYSSDTEHFRASGPWELATTYDLIHTLQPRAMVGNNHHVLPLKGEDYQVFELDLPGQNTAGFNTTEVSDLPLVAWFKLNRQWSYFEGAQEVEPGNKLTGYVTESAKRNAVCWLNAGPTPAGEILAEEAAALRDAGTWLRKHGEKSGVAR